MASTFILGKKSLPLDAVRLGRLVVDIDDPHNFYYDPDSAAGLAQIVTERNDFQSIDESDRGRRFFLKLTRLVSSGYSKRHGFLSQIDTKCVKHYWFGNSTQYFRDIVQLTETKKWIETALKEGGKICLLVGYMTFQDAAVTEYEAKYNSAEVSVTVPVPEPVLAVIHGDLLDTGIGANANRGAAVKSKFTAKGEQVFALQYRKVKISLHNSKDAKLSKPNRWEVLTKHRQAYSTKTNDVLEADITESEEGDDFEFDEEEDDDDEWTKIVDEGSDFYL